MLHAGEENVGGETYGELMESIRNETWVAQYMATAFGHETGSVQLAPPRKLIPLLSE
jgi:hypothetical protein